MKYQQKLAQLAQRELPALMDRLIVKDDRGFQVFGRYRIEPKDHGYSVLRNTDPVAQFRQTRTALAWCIADRMNHINLACQIASLEAISTRYSNDIHTRTNIGEQIGAGQQWEIISHKLARRTQQRLAVDSELEKCISQAKYYQIRGFYNETD